MERRRELKCVRGGTHSVFDGGVVHTVKNRVCAAIFFIVCFFARTSYADQFNDLYYIDPGGVPDLTEEGKQNASGGGSSGGTTSGGGSTGGGSTGGSSTSGTSGGTSGGSGSVTGTGGSGSGTGDGDEEQTEEEQEDSALQSLFDEGVISGGLGGVDSGVFSGGGGAIVVSGSRVRAFIRKDPNIDDVLRYWKIGKGKTRPDGKTSKDRLTPGEYYALVAATLAAEDEGLQEARFTARDFEITYRSRGSLFAFIPWSFPVRVLVVPRAPNERVTVRFPWYHWFVREYFTRAELSLEIDSMIQVLGSKAEEGEDIQGELFDAVHKLLREKVRTITETILLK